jgi:hypothetical protein
VNIFRFKKLLVWPVPLAQVLPHPQRFFLPKPGFWEFFWIFSGRNHFKINIPHILNPILPNKFHLILHIKIFPTTPKAHSNSSKKIQLRFNLIFSEEIIQYSRTFAPQVQTSWNQAHAPLHIESFPKTPRTGSEASWLDGSHNYKTKQTTFLLR